MNLSIVISPSVLGTRCPAFHRECVTPFLTGYNHEIKRMGGFWSAEFNLAVTDSEVSDWVEHALGADVAVYNEFGRLVWEGFINSLSVNIGSYRFKIGPVTEVANKLKIKYTTTRYDIVGIGGEDAETAYAEDTASQARFGILPLIYSGGEGDAGEMDQLRDAMLEQTAWPRPTDQALNVGEAVGPAGVSVQCAGYAQMLGRYYYAELGASQVAVSDKIITVVNANPNAWFSTDWSRVTENLYQVYETEEDANEQVALDIINEAVSLGDANLNLYGFGVYEARRVVYEPAATRVTLEWRMLTDPARLYRLGVETPLSEIRPNEWVFVSDLMPGEAPRALGRDPRIMYVESVSYSAPGRLQLSGSRITTLSQRVAQIANKGL